MKFCAVGEFAALEQRWRSRGRSSAANGTEIHKSANAHFFFSDEFEVEKNHKISLCTSPYCISI